jgi:hypothetical protein
MRESDSALDAIGNMPEEFYSRCPSGAVFKKCVTLGRKLDGNEAQAVLGAIEELIERKTKLTPGVKSLALRCIEICLHKQELARWRDPKERQAALMAFKKVLAGKGRVIPKRDQGLMFNLAKRLGHAA